MTHNIKQITGEDSITARGLYKDPIEFHATCKLNLLTNYIPPVNGSAPNKARFSVIYYDQIFKDDPKEGEQKKDNEFI